MWNEGLLFKNHNSGLKGYNRLQHPQAGGLFWSPNLIFLKLFQAEQHMELTAWAKGMSMKTKYLSRFIPDWNMSGKRAGFLRNQDTGDYADAIIAFWDSKSRAKKNIMYYAKKNGVSHGR